ncbi:hypothetical protein AB4J97_10410 [Serratia fonticola]
MIGGRQAVNWRETPRSDRGWDRMHWLVFLLMLALSLAGLFITTTNSADM